MLQSHILYNPPISLYERNSISFLLYIGNTQLPKAKRSPSLGAAHGLNGISMHEETAEVRIECTHGWMPEIPLLKYL